MAHQEIKMIGILKSFDWEYLDTPEFIGEGLRDIDDARDAAREAIDYIGDDCDAVEIYVDGELVETVRR